jgi:hypothetical protein
LLLENPSSRPKNCPINTTLVEYANVGGLQISLKRVRNKSATSTTSPVTFITSEATASVIDTNWPTNLPQNSDGQPYNPNRPLWIIIGCQFLVIVVLVACLLRHRLPGLRDAIKFKSVKVLQIDNVPLPYQEFATPIQQVVDLPPTPRAAFQHPPPPAEAVYEVNTNYGEAPTVRRAKLPVYEDHKFNTNNPSPTNTISTPRPLTSRRAVKASILPSMFKKHKISH